MRIQGVGVIDDALLELHPGFTVVTGETGAGKTMVVTGLHLLSGGRSDASRVRAGANKAVVEGRFELADAQDAVAVAEEAGVAFARAATAGVDPRFVTMVRELLLERAAAERAREDGTPEPLRPAVGVLEPSWDVCPAGCCANARGPRPALCGRD